MIGDTNEEPKKRWRPVPIYDSGLDINKSYLRKDILAEIGNNLNELVEIKSGTKQTDIFTEPKKITTFEQEISKETQSVETKNLETKTNESTNNITSNLIKQTDVVHQIPNKLDDSNKNILKIPKIVPENKEIKLGISNIDNSQIDKQNDKNSTVNKSKKKVKRMNDEDSYVSPEHKRALLKSELDEIKKQERLLENSSEALRKADEAKAEMKKLELKILDMSKEFEGTVGNKFKEINSTINNFDSKIGKLNTDFNHVHEKLEKTCTGIECLTNDFKKLNENKTEFAECNDCHNPKVPYKSSYCPGCGKELTWYEDDGVTPIKGWTPAWKKLKQ